MKISKFFTLLILVLLIMVNVLPILYLTLLSILPQKAISGSLSLSFNFDVYRSLYLERGFSKYILNSFLVSIFSVLLTLVLCIPAAYFSSGWGWRRGLIGFIISCRLIPQFAIIVPLYLMYRTFALQDTVAGLVLVQTFLNIPIALLIMRRFFATFNREVVESALCDGSSHADAFFRIILPLTKEGVLVTAGMCFIMSWNELPFTLMLTDRNAVTSTKALLYLLYSSRGIILEQLEDIQFLGAAVIMQLIPVIFFVLVIQKLFSRLFR